MEAAMLKATKHIRAAAITADRQRQIPFDVAVLAQDERHLRRKVITLTHGDRVLVDFPEPITLEDRDVLVLEDGRHAEIIAAEEELLEIRGRDAVHLAALAWHIGNRHLAAAIEAERILILRDHVIKSMLEGLGAEVAEVTEPFNPLGGAYANGGHAAHGQSHDHGDDHGHDHHHGPASHAHGHGHAKHRHGE
jgi:urease accessory protein